MTTNLIGASASAFLVMTLASACSNDQDAAPDTAAGAAGAVWGIAGGVNPFGGAGEGTLANTEAGGTTGHAGGTRVTSLMGWELDATNTGLAGVGLDCDALELYDGPYEPPAGTTIFRKRIEQALFLRAGDITIDQSCVRPTSETMGRGLPILMNYDRDTGTALATTVTIRDSDIDASRVSAADIGWSAAFGGSGVIERCNIRGAGSGIWLRGLPPVVNRVEGNYIHELRHSAPDSHQDGLTIRDYTGPSTVIRNNRIDSTTGESETGPLFIQPGFGFVDHVLIEGNLLEGNNWKLQLEASTHGYGTDLSAINNRFAPTGYGSAFVSGGSGWSVWRENYLNDPAQPEYRGAAVSAPKP